MATRSSLPSYPSMKSASGATGIPVRVFQEAKAAGCPAFDAGSRVSLQPFLRWWFTRGEEAGAQDDEARKLKAEADLAEIKVAKAQEVLVLVADVERWASQVVSAIRQGILASQLDSETQDELIATLRKLLEGVAPADASDAESGPDPDTANADDDQPVVGPPPVSFERGERAPGKVSE